MRADSNTCMLWHACGCVIGCVSLSYHHQRPTASFRRAHCHVKLTSTLPLRLRNSPTLLTYPWWNPLHAITLQSRANTIKKTSKKTGTPLPGVLTGSFFFYFLFLFFKGGRNMTIDGGRRIIILGVLISTLMMVLMVSGPIQSQRIILTTLPADTAGLPTHWRCCVCCQSVYLFVWISACALSTQNSEAPPRPPTNTYDW